jgi:hypothetical protein
LQFAQADAHPKNCKRDCLSATADFADTKKLNLLRQETSEMIEFKINLKTWTDMNAQLVTLSISA